MIWRIWLHLRSRVSEVKAAAALRRASRNVTEHAFFCAEMDGYVHTLRALNQAQGD